MSRRKPHHEEELPFVALMDTMTNVVGVLIIVLVFVGIGLATSVKKVLSDLPPVTVEEHEKLKKQVENAAVKEDPKKLEEELAKLEKELKKSAEELAALDATKEKQNIRVIDFDSLQKQLEEKRKQRDQLKETVAKLLTDVDKLKARLDQTPVFTPPPPAVVKLPNPRPMPDQAQIYRFLVANKRVFFFNEEDTFEFLEQELKRADSFIAVSHETLKGPDGKPVMKQEKSGRPSPKRRTTYDLKKLTDYFTRRRLSNREVAFEVLQVPNSNRIQMRLTPLPNAGEDLERVRMFTSGFQNLLRKLKADPKAVVWFMVYKDSIDTYHAVREVTDQLGLPAGWELAGASTITRWISDEYVVNFTPVAAPPPPGGPAPAVTIAPPKATLD
jgi:cell division protein FtsB